MADRWVQYQDGQLFMHFDPGDGGIATTVLSGLDDQRLFTNEGMHDQAVTALQRAGYIISPDGKSWRERQRGEYAVHTEGVDDPGSCQEFESLLEARRYLRGRIDYYRGATCGSSDFMVYHTLGFTLADIGCFVHECEPFWAPSADELTPEGIMEAVGQRASELDHLAKEIIGAFATTFAKVCKEAADEGTNLTPPLAADEAWDRLSREFFDRGRGGALFVLETVYNEFLATGTL